jgi:hypothetical protein
LPLSENAVAGYDVALAPQTSRDLDQLDQELDQLGAAIEMLDNSTMLYQRPEGTSIDVPQAQASDPEPVRSPVAARVRSAHRTGDGSPPASGSARAEAGHLA